MFSYADMLGEAVLTVENRTTAIPVTLVFA
jgi:hypothetical protein